MDRAQLQKLLEKYESGTCTDEERELLHRFYDAFQSDEGLWTDVDLAEKESLRADIFRRLNTRIDDEDKHTRGPRKFSWQVAASVVLAISVALCFYFGYQHAKPQLITAKTGRGERTTVNLPDGSVVQLNAGSSLTYPQSFSDTREVTLIGEAFFDVERNPEVPFVVHTGSVETTVLGTSFNVNAYPSTEAISVTVASGKVRVASAAQACDLLPGEQATYREQYDELVSQKVDIEKFVAWADGRLVFDGATLQEVITALSLWYGVEITFDQPQQAVCDLKMTFKDLSLVQVLNQLRLVTGIDYQFDGHRQVRILGVGCAD